jgi:predicted transcriptional regulator
VSVTVDDELWAAVGDPTRRQMLDLLLTDGRGTPATLSGQLPVTRQAIAKHLGVVARVRAGPRQAVAKADRLGDPAQPARLTLTSELRRMCWRR